MTIATASPLFHRILPLAAALLLLVVPARAQETFTVTVEDISTEHPYADENVIGDAYAIDGEQGAVLTLERGTTYTFEMNGVPTEHPFYISTDAEGAGAGEYSEGVSGNFATGNETVTFTPDSNTPDTLYYQCGNHQYMGWRIVVEDAAEEPATTVDFEAVATGLTAPVALVEAPDESGRLFVVEQTGQIRIIQADGTLQDEPFLDVSGRLVDLGEGYDERGLLGLAFHPDYADNGRFFVYYSARLREGAPDGWNHTSRVSEFMVTGDDPDQADADSEEILLRVDQPQSNHNAGALAFGPRDRYLYIALGDGGGADDTGMGHVDDWYDFNDGGNAQDVEDNLLGSILRIDVDTGDPYGIPEDNPFAGREGLDEVWAYGFRNPYRFSFDPGGDNMLFVGDAGQNRWEEVSVVEQGGNYGWNVYEGTHCFDAANPNTDASECPNTVGEGHPDEGEPLIAPVIEFLNAQQEAGLGLVVVGGNVYRGSELSSWDGQYVFGQWSTDFGTPDGDVFVTTSQPNDSLWSFERVTAANLEGDDLGLYVLAFGQDRDGEVYVLTSETAGPSGSTGTVYRIVPEGTASPAEPLPEQPEKVALAENYPNPFVDHTTLRFHLPQAADARLAVYDVTGRRVAVVVDERLPSGWHQSRFEADGLAAGPYFYRLEAGSRSASGTLTVVK